MLNTFAEKGSFHYLASLSPKLVRIKNMHSIILTVSYFDQGIAKIKHDEEGKGNQVTLDKM